MGLRETVASATAALIASRILCCYCIPLSNYPLTKNLPGNVTATIANCNRDIKTNKNLNKMSTNIVGAANESQITRFPEVEHASSSQVWDYYRFQNDYGDHLKSNSTDICTKKTFQTEKHGWDIKKKRKHNIIANSKTRPETKSVDLEHDSVSQPYCIGKSSFFPEMEYPLSARDMWIPCYWNRHFGTENEFNMDAVEPVTNIEKLHIKNENCLLNDIPNTVFGNIKTRPKSSSNNKQEEARGRNVMTLVSNEGETYLSELTTETLSMLIPMTIPSEASNRSDFYGTTESMTLHEDIQNITSDTMSDFNNSDVTTISPFECLTHLPSLCKETEENFLLSATHASSDESMSTTVPPSSSVGISTDETPPPATITESTPSEISIDKPKASIYNGLDNINENWIFSPNDSYITWESIPEYCDEWIILVDSKIPADHNMNCSTTLEKLTSDQFKPVILSGSNGNVASNVSTDFRTSLMTWLSDSRKIFIDNITNIAELSTTKSIVNSLVQESVYNVDQKSVPVVNDPENLNKYEEAIPTLQYSDDDECAPYTESPFVS